MPGSAEDEWTVNHHIVAPRVYHTEILKLAPETPMSSHLGVNVTYYKILQHYNMYIIFSQDENSTLLSIASPVLHV